MSLTINDAFKSAEDIQGRIVEKAAEDSEFRAALLADPKSALREELQIKVPDIIEITVHESKGTSLHLALPPDLSDLDMDQLAAVAAGNHFV